MVICVQQMLLAELTPCNWVVLDVMGSGLSGRIHDRCEILSRLMHTYVSTHGMRSCEAHNATMLAGRAALNATTVANGQTVYMSHATVEGSLTRDSG